jgi:DNA-binding response OmpR family regulator
MSLDVLIVDDDPDIRTTLAELLSEEGYSVEKIDRIAELAPALERTRPRLVLLDLTLPGQNLQSVLAEAHERNLLGHSLVYAMSGLDETRDIANELGLDGAVRKPFEIAELLAVIEKVCRSEADRTAAEPPGAHPA